MMVCPMRTCISILMSSIAIMISLPIACPAQDISGKYTVQGIVLDSVSHQPIARALVEATTGAVLTDHYGNFQLHLAEGNSQIRHSRPGYGSLAKPAVRTVRVAANVSGLVFSLTPSATITGHVTLSAGDEADGVHIMAYR